MVRADNEEDLLKTVNTVLAAVNTMQSSVNTIQTNVTDMKADVSPIKTKVDTIDTRVWKHEKVLYGDPEQMGEGGVIDSVGKLKASLSGLKTTFVAVWTFAFAIIQIAIYPLVEWGKSWFMSGKPPTH